MKDVIANEIHKQPVSALNAMITGTSPYSAFIGLDVHKDTIGLPLE